MKLRNRLIALLCIFAFAAIGFLVFKKWVVQRPFAIILFVTDNLDPRTMAAARLYGGRSEPFEMETMGRTVLLRSISQQSPVADSASAASLVSGGQPVGWNQTPTSDVSLLLREAKANGRSIGLISSGWVARSAAAAFVARGVDARDGAAVAGQLLGETEPDVLLGGGYEDFLPELKEGKRQDARDLMLEARKAGYTSIRNTAELEGYPTWQRPKLLGLFSPGAMAYRTNGGSSNYQPSLSTMVRKAIQLLAYDAEGYVLVVDAGLGREAAYQQKPEAALQQMLELDEAVRVAQQYSGRKSVIAVAGLANIGGLALTGKPFPGEQGNAFLTENRHDVPFLQWNTEMKSPVLAGDQLFFLREWEKPLPGDHWDAGQLHQWLLDQL